MDQTSKPKSHIRTYWGIASIYAVICSLCGIYGSYYRSLVPIGIGFLVVNIAIKQIEEIRFRKYLKEHHNQMYWKVAFKGLSYALTSSPKSPGLQSWLSSNDNLDDDNVAWYKENAKRVLSVQRALVATLLLFIILGFFVSGK